MRTKSDDLVILAVNPKNVYDTLKKFYLRVKPKELKTIFLSDCNRVIRLMKKRNASAQEINQFKEEVKGLKKELGIRPMGLKM